MARATTLLFLFICGFPQLAFANATNSSKIGISVVVKEKLQCDLHIANTGQPNLYLASSSNCEINAEKIQKQFTSANNLKLAHTSDNGFSRVVLTVQ